MSKYRSLQLASLLASFAVLATPPATAQSFDDEEVLLERFPGTTHFSVGDLDGDGRPDLVGRLHDTQSTSYKPLVWYRNDPVAGFERQTDIGIPWSFYRVEPVDLDLDGDLDLVISTYFSPDALMWLENDGSGQFAPPQPFVTVSDSRITQFIARDFDGDGDLDFAMGLLGSFGGSSIEVAMNLSTAGGGLNFGAPTTLASSAFNLVLVEAEDLDGDNDIDILAGSEELNTAVLYENLGAGSFASERVLQAQFAAVGSMQISDVNGDGALDVIGANTTTGAVTWIPALGNGAFGPPLAAFTESGTVYGLTAIDVEGDGRDEYLIATRDGASSFWGGSYSIRRNANGLFGPRLEIATTDFVPLQFHAVDLDLDGHTDLVARSLVRVTIHRGDGSTFGEKQRLAEDIEHVRDPIFRDLDDDGDADAIIIREANEGGYSWIENRGGGRFGEVTQGFSSLPLGEGDAVDLDGDGDLDMIVSGGSSSGVKVYWLENLGQQRFSSPHLLFSRPVFGSSTALPGDMEGDGDVDLLVNWWNGNSTTSDWLVNTGTGFVPGPSLGNSGVGRAPVLSDISGDGLVDLVYVRFDSFSSNNPLAWRRNLGQGVLGTEVILGQPNAQLYDATVGDVDGNGTIDLAAAGRDGTELYRNLGNGVFGAREVVDSERSFQVFFVDNSDTGFPDLLTSVSQGVARWYESLNGVFPSWTSVPGFGRGVVAVADIDGDLDLDIVQRRYDGTISFNRSTRRFGVGYCGPMPVHSGGRSAVISAKGSPFVAANNVTLLAERLPPQQFGFFFIADGRGFAPNPGGSQGNLCVSGDIGRLIQGPGSIFLSDAAGTAAVPLDLTQVPTPHGTESLLPGDTRFAQAWFRDTNPTSTSNFTSGLELVFK